MGSKEYFDEVARDWDKLQSSFFSEEVREKAFTKANVGKGELAADIGAGTGFFIRNFCQGPGKKSRGW